MASSMLTIRMDSEVKDGFLGLCEELGMTASAAVNMLARQMLRDKKLPFVPSLGSDGASANPAEKSAVLTGDAITRAVHSAATGFPQIEKVILFGSYARDEATDASDVDLRILYTPKSGFSLLDLSAFASSVEGALGKSVDVVSKRELDEVLAAEIARDGVTIYDR